MEKATPSRLKLRGTVDAPRGLAQATVVSSTNAAGTLAAPKRQDKRAAGAKSAPLMTTSVPPRAGPLPGANFKRVAAYLNEVASPNSTPFAVTATSTTPSFTGAIQTSSVEDT